MDRENQKSADENITLECFVLKVYLKCCCFIPINTSEENTIRTRRYGFIYILSRRITKNINWHIAQK